MYAIRSYYAGKEAIEELASQTAELLNGRSAKAAVYPKQIAFNVLPQIDVFQENGYTKEEMKMVWETRKIMGDDSIMVNPTTVRVPVFYGHRITSYNVCYTKLLRHTDRRSHAGDRADGPSAAASRPEPGCRVRYAGHSSQGTGIIQPAFPETPARNRCSPA